MAWTKPENDPLDPPPDPAEYHEVTLIAPEHIMQPHSAPMNADFPELDGDSSYQDDLEIPSFGTSASIHWGQQGKHIPEHNIIRKAKSILTHPDPQFLLDNHSGAGITVPEPLEQQVIKK